MANHQIPLVEHFGVSKTLLSQIANSPYFKKFDSTVFSKILFKPGYPLQSVELIELQDIIQEQIRRFGNHIFKDGSIVTSDGGVDVNSCILYELQDGANEQATITSTDTISFVDRSTDTELLRGNFIDFYSARIVDGVVQPTLIGLIFNNGLTQTEITSTNTIDVYVRNAAGVNTTHIGILNSITSRAGRYANIKNNTFYISGYFTNITEQNHIFAIDNINTMDVEVGVELTWRIVDITDDEYKEQLYDPSQNLENDNTPGADRLILKLQLAHHTYEYTQQETDWKFIPLLKYSNGNIIFRTRYPFYSVLGDTLARRTYEINGNFVVDNFKLEVRSDLLLEGTHNLALYEIVGDELVYTINGTNTDYFQLNVGNYIMFGPEIDYNRLLLIKEIDSSTKIKVSDIHYDQFEDRNSEHLLTPVKVGSDILLRDEEKLNYVLSEGKAYVKGYRFETTFNSRLKDNKARKFSTQGTSVFPNQHYFELDDFYHSEDFIYFDRLDLLDLHCTRNTLLYDLDIRLSGNFSQSLSIGIGERIQIGTNGAIFEKVEGTRIYKLISYTKNNSIGIPTPANYTITNLSTSPNVQGLYNLATIAFIEETPYRRIETENYVSTSVVDNTFKAGSIIGDRLTFETGTDSYSGKFVVNDYIILKDQTTNEEFFGFVSNIVSPTEIEIRSYPTLITTANDFTITKPSYQSYYNYQYNSTKIGTIRANSVGVDDPERFRFSHFKITDTPKNVKVSNFTVATISTISLELSRTDDVYNGMYIENNGSKWKILDYDGGTQTFTLDNVSLTNPFNFTIGDDINLIFDLNDIDCLIKSSYINGKEFYGNIKRTSFDTPTIKTNNQTQKKFANLLNEGEGEVKTVSVSDYSIFYQDAWVVAGGNTNVLSKNIGNIYQEDYPTLNTDNIKVYAGEIIYDNLGTGNILHHKGEEIIISSAAINNYILTINFPRTYVNGDSFVVHADLPVRQPVPRFKNLETYTDSFSVSVDVANKTLIRDNTRYHGQTIPTFELMHSDIYRIRRVSVGLGKTAPLVDLTNYFTLDNGQRETHYDYGNIVLKPFLKLPEISGLTTTNAFYFFEVEYDYFESTIGHYFTVDSYTDIHYRKIPTYVDPKKEKYPLRNVIDFRPVRLPKGSLYDFEQETDIVSLVFLDFDYYLNQNKVISLEGNGSSDIALAYENEEDYQPSDYNIKLYDLTIPAYTFIFEDVEFKLIDNRNYTMKDISKLQKRIENLEDIVQLNALELQSLQTNLTDSSGNPRYTNGLIVDMFAGFAIAKADEGGFAASIDINNMKMYPSFNTENSLLKPSPSAIINSTYPRLRNNIITLPILNDIIVNNSITASKTTSKSTQINSIINGKLLLHPFSDTWFSKNEKPILLLNEDNQFKNWKQLTVSDAFKSQWGMWEQFWSGVEIDKNIITLQNATLSQKTGQMVNSKNNIEKIIGDKKINTTLSLLNRGIRLGFTLELLENDAEEYEIYASGSPLGFQQGQRLLFEASTSTPKDTFVHKFLNMQINQTIPLVGTANGVIRNIQYIDTPTPGTNRYYLYVTNITDYLFVDTADLNNLSGDITNVHTFSTLHVDSNNKMCGDILLDEGEYSTSSSIEIVIKRKSSKIPVASNKFYLGGLLETKTSFTQSIRPVQRKLYTNDNENYIDDKTFIINSSTQIKHPLHQPFVFDQSQFISKIDIHCKNPNAVNDRNMMLTIQPMVNDNLSPSLVVPFSEKIVKVPAGHDGALTISFDVPIFIASNSEYALTFRSEEEILIYTKVGTNTILYDPCVPALSPPSGSEVLQINIYRALFDINEKQISLFLKNESFNHFVDRYRLNANILKLTDTYTDFAWKARNYDTTIKDLEFKDIPTNKTILLEKRKIFDYTNYELRCRLRSNDDRYSPVIDLDRLSITTIQHYINDGKILTRNVTTSRTGANTDLVQITLTEDPIPGIYAGGVCKLDIDSSNTLRNFYSDPKFLMYSNDYDLSIQKANTSTGIFESFTDPVTIDNVNKVITSTDLNINVNTITEFDATNPGSAAYRYFSPIVTLGDDFEAMQLYVQMDAILKRVNEVFVYYRVLDNTRPFDTFTSQSYKRMNILTIDSDKYSNSNNAKTIEFESNRLSTDPRFKYFQVKICFTSSNYIDVPVLENVRILALDN